MLKALITSPDATQLVTTVLLSFDRIGLGTLKTQLNKTGLLS